MAESKMSSLFPTKISFAIFISYMALFINQGILVRFSQSGSKYKYSTVMAVLFTECVKLVTATVIYLREKSVSDLWADIVKHSKVFLLYFVPAGLYCLYNNLGFVNLAAYDPTTYFLLLQFRVVVTGVIFQMLFSKKLSLIQWISLMVLTIGCIIKEIGPYLSSSLTPAHSISSATTTTSFFDIHLLLILVQVFCSCFAGVYNEYLLKDVGCDVHIMIQNIFMYVDSIVCNLVILIITGQLSSLFSYDDLKSLARPSVIAIIINNAAIGIITSLFLRSLNSILKTFASALELMFTAVLCWIIFGIEINVSTVIAIAVVSAAVFIYARHPVVNKPKNERTDGDPVTAGEIADDKEEAPRPV